MEARERTPRILIADDQRDVVEAIRVLLKGEGFETAAAGSPAEVMERLGSGAFDALLMDLNYARDTTSGREGLELLERIRHLEDAPPVIVMTAWASVELAVEAMRAGARDFIEKPWDNNRLLSVLSTQVELGRALRRSARLEATNRLLTEAGRPDLIAESKAMQPVLQLIERVGPSAASVLITGENGTGKNVVARALHAVSDRADRPLLTVNVGGLPETVFESELFGHVRGAFTDARSDRVGRFELADGGTLFLDEIGNLSAAMQARLLRVVESGEFERVGSSRTQAVDVRLLSATNSDLDGLVEEGRFRSDLLFRLRTVEIHLPPLRERRDDIPLLADLFLKRQARQYGKRLDGFEEAALRALLTHRWPGNVRELEHAVERAVLMAEGRRIREQDLDLAKRRESDAVFEEMTLDEAERVLIRRALARHDGNVSQAAEALGVSRSALYRRIEKYEL
jgi:DNA-binding NtrC family response regulator